MAGERHAEKLSAGEPVVVKLPEVVDITTVPGLRREYLRDLAKGSGAGFSLDGSAVRRIDGVGLGLIAELRDLSDRKFHRALKVQGLPTAINHLVGLAAIDDLDRCSKRKHRVFLTDFGAIVERTVRGWAHLVAFVGEVIAAVASIVVSPRQVRWREFPDLARSIGADAIFIISLLGFLIGAILAFQTSVPLDRFGAVELIPTIVGIAILRELGPLIAAILVAGRTGAAFAAEIGTMQVTEELSALRVMGVNPTVFLVVPRILATVLMLPLLAVYTDLMGVFGGFAVMGARGSSLTQYLESMKSGVTAGDVLGGIVKTVVFGALIAMAGCECGIRTGAGPAAVGRSTTRAVVSSIILVVVADVAFGFLFYMLGI